MRKIKKIVENEKSINRKHKKTVNQFYLNILEACWYCFEFELKKIRLNTDNIPIRTENDENMSEKRKVIQKKTRKTKKR